MELSGGICCKSCMERAGRKRRYCGVNYPVTTPWMKRQLRESHKLSDMSKVGMKRPRAEQTCTPSVTSVTSSSDDSTVPVVRLFKTRLYS